MVCGERSDTANSHKVFSRFKEKKKLKKSVDHKEFFSSFLEERVVCFFSPFERMFGKLLNKATGGDPAKSKQANGENTKETKKPKKKKKKKEKKKIQKMFFSFVFQHNFFFVPPFADMVRMRHVGFLCGLTLFFFFSLFSLFLKG